ncbi:hypothetical protein [Roseibium sp.]|uniref:hypothetical protein n=1 Tax=Roseibium sp. TaxID=1936156 RepID=UPI003D14172E
MAARVTGLHMLRRERHPLVVLTALAFAMRLVLLVLAGALTPEAASAAGLVSLCQPSKHLQSAPAGQHDPLACQCGPVCAHGCTLGPCLAGAVSNPDQPDLPTEDRLSGTGQATVHPLAGRVTAIRGPPASLI